MAPKVVPARVPYELRNVDKGPSNPERFRSRGYASAVRRRWKRSSEDSVHCVLAYCLKKANQMESCLKKASLKIGRGEHTSRVFSTLAAQDMEILQRSLTTPDSEMTADQQRLLKRARNRLSLCFAEDRLIVFA